MSARHAGSSFVVGVLLLASAPSLFGQATLGQATLGPPIEIEAAECCTPSFDWTKSEFRYQSTSWLTGATGNALTGPGYYSLMDLLRGEYRDEAPKSGYRPVISQPLGFAEANFSYVDDPKYEPTRNERLHRIHLGENWVFGTGGEYRNRFNYEGNARLSGRHNSFDLNRVRIFAELWHQDDFRIHAEFIDARTTGETLAPGQSDRNYHDLLSLFVDVKTLMIGDDPVYARLGRQQLLLGSQRIISTSDWGFTGRTFDGARLYRRSEKFEANAFWLQPVIPVVDRFDVADPKQHFAGVYTSYRPTKDKLLEAYWLFLHNGNDAARARTRTVGAITTMAPYDVHTLGFRYAGKAECGFLWEMENMLQLGDSERGDIVAGNLTNGVGYHLRDLPLNPTVWAYFDYATGSSTPGGPNTFNQLFPLAHYYLGQSDYVGRANIQDLNFHLYLYPSRWITLNMQYHIFHLARAADALYTTGAAVSRSDPSGRSGRDVGSELDVSTAIHVGPHVDILTVYSHFFAGDFLHATGPSSNADTVFLLFNYRW